jgi:4a-hydroxytetrahydrobiopterin dehydratase
MSLLPESEVDRRLGDVQGWLRQGNAILKTFSFDSFAAAIAFVNRVAAVAEAQDHHPDILVQYRKVTLTLSSHDAGGLTERDFRLAREIPG